MISYRETIPATQEGSTYSSTYSITENQSFYPPDDDIRRETGASLTLEIKRTASTNGAATAVTQEQKFYSDTRWWDEFSNQGYYTSWATWEVTEIIDTEGLIRRTVVDHRIEEGGGGDDGLVAGGDYYYFDNGGEPQYFTDPQGMVASEKTTTTQTHTEKWLYKTAETETFIATGTTTVITDGTVPRTVATTKLTETQTTNAQQQSQMVAVTQTTTQEDFVLRRTWTNVYGEPTYYQPPRAYKTIYALTGNEAVWDITNTLVDDWTAKAISEIAILRTNSFTILPTISTSTVPCIGSTLPEDVDITYETISESYTDDSFVTHETLTKWEHGTKAFPLESYPFARNKYDTSVRVVEWESQMNLGRIPISSRTSIAGGNPRHKNSVSYSAWGGNQLVQPYSWTYTSSYEPAWFTTSSESYDGANFEGGYDDYPPTYLNGIKKLEGGESITSVNAYQNGWNQFNPARIFHQETGFFHGWNKFGEDENPASKIDWGLDFWPLFSQIGAELKHLISAVFPHTITWTSGNSTMSGKMFGNAATITSIDSNSFTTQSYSAQSQGSAITEEKGGPVLPANLADLPFFTIVGNNPATSTNKAIGVAGIYGKITFNSAHSAGVNTIRENSAFTEAIVDAPRVYFDAQKRWWPVKGGGGRSVFTNRCVTPDPNLPR